jgi:ADP-heptose:LPS heptosyltransferase
VVVEERFREIFEGNPDIERLIAPGIENLRDSRPELCLNLHGGTTSALMTACSGARLRAGFAHFRFPFVYNVKIPTAQQVLGVLRKVHTAEHMACAMFHLGAARTEIPNAQLFAAPPAARDPYAVIHPFASEVSKSWPVDRYLELARRLRPVSGLEPVFITGQADDPRPLGAFPVFTGAALSQVKSLLRGASLFIGNDSGPAHMAAALGIPVVALFGSSDPAIWGPWRTVSEIVAAPSGIEAISLEQVLEAVDRLRVHA